MAEPSKPKSPRSTRSKAKAKPVEDAVVVDEIAPEAEEAVEVTASATEAAEKLEEAIEQAGEADTPAPDEDPENTPVETELPEPTIDAPEATEPAVEEVAETPPVPVIAAPEPRRGGFFPVFLGGVVAAGLGAGALFVAQDRGWLSLGGTGDMQATIDLQRGEIAVLKAAVTETSTRISALEGVQVDGAAIDGALGALQTATEATSTGLSAVGETVAALRTRVEDVETQPIPKAELPAEVVAAYEMRLAEMMGTVDTRFGAMQTVLDGKLAEISAAQTAASQSEVEAMRAADAAEARGALSRVGIALENGAGFASELQIVADKAGLDVPAVLSGVAADGAPTLTALKAAFPDVAREALTAATHEAAADGSVSPLSAFLRTQLGARSLEPREGDDADAVLSRAEAAVAGGDLDAALSEISALPQVGQDVLAAWVAQAETRRAALAAAAALSAELNN